VIKISAKVIPEQKTDSESTSKSLWISSSIFSARFSQSGRVASNILKLLSEPVFLFWWKLNWVNRVFLPSIIKDSMGSGLLTHVINDYLV